MDKEASAIALGGRRSRKGPDYFRGQIMETAQQMWNQGDLCEILHTLIMWDVIGIDSVKNVYSSPIYNWYIQLFFPIRMKNVLHIKTI